jgi:hypothetical protein
VSRFWGIDDNQAVLDSKKNSKTFLEKNFAPFFCAYRVASSKAAPKNKKKVIE